MAVRGSLWLCAVVCVIGCDGMGVTQVIIETETDYALGSELARVEWELRSTAEVAFSPVPAVELTPETELPLTLTVVPASDPHAPIHVLARGLGPDGSVLVEQRRSTQFAQGVSSVLRFELSRRCEGVVCAPAQTCVNASDEPMCLSVEVGSENLPPFRAGRPSGTRELCNGRDDDGDGSVDEDYDFMTSPRHCGGCFVDCPDPVGGFGDPVCDDGACAYECDTLRADCDSSIDNGCETDLLQPSSCGACSVSCPPSAPSCLQDGDTSACTNDCGAFADCAGVCADLQNDPDHCGACDAACESVGPRGSNPCVAAGCEPRCDTGWHLCDGFCASDSADESCGLRCDPCPTTGPQVVGGGCESEVCVLECEHGWFDCNGDGADGCEVSASGTDPRNCGGCGIDCGYGSCGVGRCSSAVKSFEVGPRHTCAVLLDGTAWCWGANESGQSAPGRSSTRESRPVFVGRETPGRVFFSFLPMDDRTTYLGTNGLSGFFDPYGTLQMWGLDPRVPAEPPTIFPAPVVLPTGIAAPRELGAGGGAALYLRTGVGPDALQLFGMGFQGTEAFSTLDDPHDPSGYIGPTLLDPTIVLEPPLGRTLARGGNVTCMRVDATAGPTLRCWGIATPTSPAYVGNGNAMGQATPFTVQPTRTTFAATGEARFDVGYGAACAPFAPPRDPARYYCWGAWDCGPYEGSPQQVPGTHLADAIPYISVGESAACAVERLSGRLVCWGRSLVDGTCVTDQHEPFAVTGVVTVRLGRSHGCYLRRASGSAANGALYCWGSNEFGQLGTDSAASVAGPAQVVFRTPPP